jgi:AraC-like DNA-binding protein
MSEAETYVRFEGAVRVPEHRAAIHDLFGQNLVNLDFERLDEDFETRFEGCLLPGVSLSRGNNGANRALTRDLSRCTDHLALTWLTRGRGQITQRGKAISSDWLILFDCADFVMGEAAHQVHHVNVRMDRTQLLALAPNAEDTLARPIPMEQPAFRLLQSYLDHFSWDRAGKSIEFDRVVAQHIIDLAALAVGATGDGGTLAASRGGRAARLAATKRWIAANLEELDLSVERAARAQGIGPRAVQKMFEEDGTTYSRFVLQSRLELARRRLTDSRWIALPISEVAFACGFGDLSYFNRSFRTAYGATPSDVRAAEHAAS